MKKINLKEKYLSEEDCKNDVARFNDGKKAEEEMRYCSYFDEILRQRVYVPCSIAYFYAWRNMLAEERRKKDLESRCFVPSERYRYMKKCSEDCANCPYGKSNREGTALSLDMLNGDECSIDKNNEMLDEIIDAEQRTSLILQISNLDEESRCILSLFCKGFTDAQIGKALGLKRSTVQYKKSHLFEKLKEKINDF